MPTQNIYTSQSVQCISSTYTEYKHVTVGAMYLQRLHRIWTYHSRCNVSPAPCITVNVLNRIRFTKYFFFFFFFSVSLYSVQNIAIHRIRLIFDSSNTLVYRDGLSAMYLQRLHRIWTRHSRCNVSPAPTQNMNTSQSVQCISSAYTEYEHVTVGAMYLQRLHRI